MRKQGTFFVVPFVFRGSFSKLQEGHQADVPSVNHQGEQQAKKNRASKPPKAGGAARPAAKPPRKRRLVTGAGSAAVS